MANIGNFINKLQGKKVGRIQKRWDFEAGSSLITPPVVGKDHKGESIIIFGTKNGKVFYLNDEAKVKWTYEIQQKLDQIQELFHDEESEKSISTIPVHEDINNDGIKEVIIGAETGKLYVVSEGKLLWEFNTNSIIRSTPIVEDIDGEKCIIFGSSNGKLYVLDSKGKLKWHFEADSGIESSPVLMNILDDKKNISQIVFGTDSGTVFSITTKGRLLWKFSTGGQITAKPAYGKIYGDDKWYIVIGSLDGNLYALDINGNLEWKFSTEGSIRSNAVLFDLNQDKKLEIIFGSCDNRAYCLYPNGEKMWSFETDFWVVSSPIVMDIDRDGKLEVIVGSYDASVYILDSQGEFLMNYLPGVSSVAIQSGHYSDNLTSDTGHYNGKKIWQYRLDGIVVGGSADISKSRVVFGTKDGKVSMLTHEKE